MRKILVIGAAGGVAKVAVERLSRSRPDLVFTLADLDPSRVAPSLTREGARAVRLDLFDSAALQEMVDGHDLVLHGAGPYIRTAPPVARACLARKVAYVDFADDIEAFEAMIPLHEDARRAAVTLIMGCGVSPGLTNVFAADLERRFDEVEVLDIAWASGDEGGGVMGRAVLEHVIHITGGEGARWRDGRLERFKSLTHPSRFPMGGGLGDRPLFEIAHPEPVMLGRSYPKTRLIRCFGAIDPPAVMAVVRGVARAVQDNRLDLDEAIRFMQETMGGKVVSSPAWRYALGGLASGIRERFVGGRDALSFAGYAALGRHAPFKGGILCRIEGTVDGRRKTLVQRSVKAGPGTFVDSMAGATGTCAAAFTLLALERTLEPGLQFPEAFPPDAVYAALDRVGASTADMIGHVIERRV